MVTCDSFSFKLPKRGGLYETFHKFPFTLPFIRNARFDASYDFLQFVAEWRQIPRSILYVYENDKIAQLTQYL